MERERVKKEVYKAVSANAEEETKAVLLYGSGGGFCG